MEGGQVLTLNQPAEFVIMGGAMIGSLLASSSISNLKKMIGQLKDIISPGMTKKDYDMNSILKYEMVQQ